MPGASGLAGGVSQSLLYDGYAQLNREGLPEVDLVAQQRLKTGQSPLANLRLRGAPHGPNEEVISDLYS